MQNVVISVYYIYLVLYGVIKYAFMFFEMAFLSGNHVPGSVTAQQIEKVVELNRKIKNNWNRNDCCTEQVLGTVSYPARISYLHPMKCLCQYIL